MAAAGDPTLPSGEQRRKADRLELLGDVSGEIMVFQPLTICEISRTGAQIETSFPLQLDSLHDVRLSLGERFVVVKSRVVHCRLASIDHELVRYRSGVEFVEQPERVETAIGRFIEAVRAGRRSP